MKNYNELFSDYYSSEKSDEQVNENKLSSESNLQEKVNKVRAIDEENRKRLEKYYKEKEKEREELLKQKELEKQRADEILKQKRAEARRLKQIQHQLEIRRVKIQNKGLAFKKIKYFDNKKKELILKNLCKKYFSNKPSYILTRFGKEEPSMKNFKKGEIVRVKVEGNEKITSIVESNIDNIIILLTTNNAKFILYDNDSNIYLIRNDLELDGKKAKYLMSKVIDFEYPKPKEFKLSLIDKIINPNKGFYHKISYYE